MFKRIRSFEYHQIWKQDRISVTFRLEQPLWKSLIHLGKSPWSCLKTCNPFYFSSYVPDKFQVFHLKLMMLLTSPCSKVLAEWKTSHHALLPKLLLLYSAFSASDLFCLLPNPHSLNSIALPFQSFQFTSNCLSCLLICKSFYPYQTENGSVIVAIQHAVLAQE